MNSKLSKWLEFLLTLCDMFSLRCLIIFSVFQSNQFVISIFYHYSLEFTTTQLNAPKAMHFIEEKEKKKTFYLRIYLKDRYLNKPQLTSLSRLSRLNSSSVSNLAFWLGTTLGILKRNLGRCCSNKPIPSKGSTLTPSPPDPAVCSLIVCIILHRYFKTDRPNQLQRSITLRSYTLDRIVNRALLFTLRRNNVSIEIQCVRNILLALLIYVCLIMSLHGTPVRSEIRTEHRIPRVQLRRVASQWRLRVQSVSKSFELFRHWTSHAHQPTSVPPTATPFESLRGEFIGVGENLRNVSIAEFTLHVG